MPVNRGWTLVRDVDAASVREADELAAAGGFEVTASNPCRPVEKALPAPVRPPKTGAGYALLTALGLGSIGVGSGLIRWLRRR